MALLGDVTADTLPNVSTRPLRRRMAGLTIFTALALIAGLVFIAVSADGREVSRASSHDGGAWLVNRELSVVGHRNRAVGELSASMRVANSPTADLFQALDVVVVHDAASNQLIEVDARSFNEDLEPTQLPEFTTVAAIDGAVLVIRNEPLTLWRVDAGALPTLNSLDPVAPLFANDSSGRVVATRQGTIAVLDIDAELLQWYFSDGTALATPLPVEFDGEIVDFTIVDESAILLLDSGDLVVVGTDGVEHRIIWQDIAANSAPFARLQQPSESVDSQPAAAAREVSGITEQGDLFAVEFPVNDGIAAALRSWGSVSGTAPLAPIVHNNCIFAVVVEPARYGISCGELAERPLEGASQELRIRLINGSVWVNDLEDGGTWITTDDLRVEAVDDWSLAEEEAARNAGEQEEEGGGDGSSQAEEIIEENPDAEGEVRTSEDFDPTKENTPPVAVDDELRTRVDRAAIVPVLANDSDANNDILVVTSVELLSGTALVSVAPSQEEVQVTPAPGFIGTVTLNYSISDGRSDPVTALVTVDVLASADLNSAPLPTTDVVATAPGNTTTVDVLLNDADPDGDAISLASIEAETGTLSWAPSGQVTFTPDSNTEAGWIELPYVVTDDLGAEATGLLRVEIRDSGANQEPDARNDHGVTVVSRPVVIQLLANDSDPDGDPLIVGSRPVLLEPENAQVQTSTTADGEFVFTAEVAGVYLFSYTVTDSADGGSESDTARIRVDVEPALENEPPVAVRDDIVIPVGQTRTAYVLDNDGDPGGDVVSIVSWQSAPGLLIEPVNDSSGHIAFQITAAPDAPELSVFQYSISDGVNPSVSAPVVVAVVNQTPRDQPPFAFDDVVEARAGATITGFAILANDFDPEGGSLRIVRVGAGQGATSIAPDGQSVNIEIPSDAVSSYSLPYDVEDEAGNRAAAVIRVQLISADAANRPPTARADVGRTIIDTNEVIEVLANDSDPDSDPIAIEGIVEQPGHGIATILFDGTIEYQPDPGFTGSDLFRYSIVDAFGDRGTGTVAVGVVDQGSANRPPIANDDSYEIKGVPSTIPLDVRDNDFDPDNDPLRILSVTESTLGSAIIDEFGRLNFVPPASLAEPSVATFDYTIVDIAGNQASATVSVSLEPYDELASVEPAEAPTPEPTPEPTVEEIVEAEATPTPEPTVEEEIENLPPIAINDDRGPVREGTEVRVEVLVNDFDPDGPAADLKVVEIDGPATLEGNVVVVVAGTRTAEVEYTIEDTFGGQATAIVTVLVTDNQAPVVEPFSATTAFETAVDLDLGGLASDDDGDELFFVCCENIRNGAIENVTADAGVFTLRFVPNAGFFGTTGFAYVVDDQQGHQTSGSVSITVSPPLNQAPVAVEDTLRLPQGVERRVPLSLYSGDPDSEELVRELVDAPTTSGISVRIVGDEAIVEIDRNVPSGTTDFFTYEISDGSLSTLGRLNIEVIDGENQPPTADDIEISVAAGSSATIDLNAHSNDSDPGDFLVWSIEGVLPDFIDKLRLTGSIVLIPPKRESAGETGQVVYTATDSRGASASAVMTITATPPTSPMPEARDDEATTSVGTIIDVPVLENDVDPLDGGLTIIAATASSGTVTLPNPTRFLRFDPGTNAGNATIIYTIRDAANREASATLTVETLGVPDKPAPPSVEAGNEQVIIQWVTPQSNGSELLGYIITSNLGVERRVGVQNSLAWDGLTNGDTYSFTVTAENGLGESEPSDASEDVTPDLLPEKPAAPQVEFRDSAVFVTWATPADNGGSDLAGYELQIGGDSVPVGSETERIAATATSFLWQGLENGLGYRFRLRAENQTDFGPWSDFSPSERPEGKPAALAAPTAERGGLSGELLIQWPALTSEQQNGGPILGYQVTASTGVTVDTGSTALEYRWSDLPNGVPVTFQVQARNRAVVSPGSSVPDWSDLSPASDEAIPCGAPDAPGAPSVTRGNGQVTVSFVELTTEQANGCGVQTYIVTAHDIDNNGATPQNTSGSPHVFSPLENGTQYQFEVRAVSEAGTSVRSDRSETVIPAGPPICATPSNVTATPTGVGEITVTWNAASENGDGPVTYEIDQGAGFQPAAGTDEIEVFTGLSNGALGTYRVRARNAVDPSPECGSASATTWDVPSDLIVNVTYDGSRLLWVTNGGVATNPPVTNWTTTMTGYGGACPVSATVLQDGDECYTLAAAPSVSSCFSGWISEFGRCAYYYEGAGRRCAAFAPAAVNLQSAYCWYRPNTTQPQCPPGTTTDPGGGCRLPVDTSDLTNCGGCTPVVVVEASVVSGTDTPLPQTRTEPITIEGQYYLEVQVCNAVGCVDNLDVAASPPPLAPGTASEYVTIGGVPDMIVPGEYYISGFGCNCYESIQRTSLVMITDNLPEDNGLPITGVAWEFTRRDIAFGPPDHGLPLENSGVLAWQSPSMSVDVDPRFGWGRHPTGVNTGQTHYPYVRMAAINSAGQAEWSQWLFGSVVGSQDPYIQIESSVEVPSCSFAVECHTFSGFLMRFGVGEVYTVDLINIETGENAPRTCIDLIITDDIGRSRFDVTCDTGVSPSDIRLRADGYLSQEQGHTQSTPDLWYTVPG